MCPKILNPRVGNDIVRDPIYDYITFTTPTDGENVAESDLIDSPWVQRLRRIRQLQSAWLVYPSATHTRFSHSLGTMHLAGEFVHQLFLRSAEALAAVASIADKIIHDVPRLVETARLYGLLHDLGHGPFGHLLDDVWHEAQIDTNHEKIGKAILTERLAETIRSIRRGPYGEFGDAIDVDVLTRLITGTELPPDAGFGEQVLSQALCGLYSPDSMDYVARDAKFCGTPEYGTVDVKRLLLHSFVDLTEVAGLALHSSGQPALADFLRARLSMYENVYFHRTARAADAEIRELLPDTLKLMDMLKDPRDDLDAWITLDEWGLLSTVLDWERNGNTEQRPLGQRWARLLRHSIPLKQAYAHYINLARMEEPERFFLRHLRQYRATKAHDIKEALETETEVDASSVSLAVDVAGLDVRPRDPIADKAKVHIFVPDPADPHRGEFETLGSVKVLATLPVKYLACRVFCQREHLSTVARVAADVFATDQNTQQTQL